MTISPKNIRVEISDSRHTMRLQLTGREAWTILALIKAGDRGCTAITHPAPRLGAYVYSLRAHGVNIETITERHRGPYPGNHARYILRSRVKILAISYGGGLFKETVGNLYELAGRCLSGGTHA